MLGVHGVLEDFGVLGVVQQREGVAFGVDGALLDGGVGFTPRHGSGVHAQLGGHGHFYGRVGRTNLQVHKILDFLEGLLGGHEVAVTEFAEHDGLQADAFGNFVEGLAKFAVVKSLVKLFLIGGRGHIGKVDSHVGFRETREVRRGAGGHIQRPGLGGFRGHAVAAELAVGEELDADLLVALLFDKLLELLIADSHVVARSHRVAKAQGKRFFSSRIIGHAEDHARGSQKGSYGVQYFFHHTSPYVKKSIPANGYDACCTPATEKKGSPPHLSKNVPELSTRSVFSGVPQMSTFHSL